MTRMQDLLEVTTDFPTRDDTDSTHSEGLLLERLRAIHHVSAKDSGCTDEALAGTTRRLARLLRLAADNNHELIFC